MTSISTLGQALKQIENIKGQQATFSMLSTQLATGKKTQVFSGLGTDILATLRSRTQLQSLDKYSNNISQAGTRVSLMLTSVGEFKAQTENLSDLLINFLQDGPHQEGEFVTYDDPSTQEREETRVGMTSSTPDTEFQSMKDLAGNLRDFLVDLLNSKDGDRYMFSGADSLTKPLEENGTLDAAMSTLITQWKAGTITTDQIIADLQDRSALDGNPDAITDSVIGYSPALSSGNAGKVFVRTGSSSEVDYTTLANEDPFRNIIVAMAFLRNENLPPMIDTYEDGVYPGTPDVNGAPGETVEEMQENFYDLFNAVTSMVNDAVHQIDNISFRLENVRVQMNEIEETHKSQKLLLESTVSNIEDVNINEVALKITTLQTQLEASFRVTALNAQLSLVNFI